jgi:hypothetical protein
VGKSERVDEGGSERIGVGATRDVAGASAGIHAPDELDFVGRDQLSAGEFGMAGALDAAAERSSAEQREFDTMNVSRIGKSST